MVSGPGLRPDGTIAREGSMSRVPATFDRLVTAARDAIITTFPATSLNSAYLYGSVPRGTAVPGTSDLDVLLALHDEPTVADRDRAATLAAALDQTFSVVDGVGIQLAGVPTLLSEVERYDLGFWVACLCTPWIGEDLAGQLPAYRPTSLLARETNGDLDRLLPRWRPAVTAAITQADTRHLTRLMTRRVVRTGFSLVMPRWRGWTSDLPESARVFGRYYPQRAAQMRTTEAAGRTTATDLDVLRLILDDLGPWLATEYRTVHGEKPLRPHVRTRAPGG
jgi:predicted nucleotidyltransferase